ncbi:MAG: hypothetical protein ACLFNL_07935 [Bacteroidales bacterium]
MANQFKTRMKNFFRTIKQHAIKLSLAFVIGATVGAVVTFFIEEKKVEFWHERFSEANELNQTLEEEHEKKKNEIQIHKQEKKELKKDMGIVILASLQSNYYNLKALKSEDYNKQMQYNEQEYISNLVPRAIGDKWDLNLFSSEYNRGLKQVVDSIAQNNSK